jgi:hypothetical protein
MSLVPKIQKHENKEKIKVKLFLSKPYRHAGEVEVYLQTFLTSAQDGGEKFHAPAALLAITTE